MNTPIHVIEASRMHRPTLLQLIFGNEMKFVEPTIPQKYWDKYHPPTHVMHDKRKKPVNFIELGIKKGLIYR